MSVVQSSMLVITAISTKQSFMFHYVGVVDDCGGIVYLGIGHNPET